MSIEVREATSAEVPLIEQYWASRTDEELIKMGVDIEKFRNVDMGLLIQKDLEVPYEQKGTYYLICFLHGNPVGHTNVGKIAFGEEAFMHLHIWHPEKRRSGVGRTMIFQALKFYFDNLQLKRVLCEPNAFNEAPNKTLLKVGFTFLFQHECVPGFINFFQPVNRYEMTREQYQHLTNTCTY